MSAESRNQADMSDCRRRLKGGSRSFHAASFVLPRGFRERASALYAFCRIADDEVDCGEDTRGALESLSQRLDDIYSGRPGACAADRALERVVAECRIPRLLLEALLEGFEWDAGGRRYTDLSGVVSYSARVAGSVGVMMSILMDVRNASMLARAADLGVAMQLTNIARDVGEDARAGRLYLPLDWLAEEGVDADAFLENPVHSDRLGAVVRRLLDVADALYQRADSGIARLPRSCRPGMFAARLLYAEIGREVRRRRYDSVSGRAVVPASAKAALLARLPAAFLLSDDALDAAALKETRYLVDAAATESKAPARGRLSIGRRLAELERQFVWVLDLFEELERRDADAARQVVASDESVA